MVILFSVFQVKLVRFLEVPRFNPLIHRFRGFYFFTHSCLFQKKVFLLLTKQHGCSYLTQFNLKN